MVVWSGFSLKGLLVPIGTRESLFDQLISIRAISVSDVKAVHRFSHAPVVNYRRDSASCRMRLTRISGCHVRLPHPVVTVGREAEPRDRRVAGPDGKECFAGEELVSSTADSGKMTLGKSAIPRRLTAHTQLASLR